MSTFSKKTSIRFYPLFKLSYWKLLVAKPRAERHASFSCSWYLPALEFNICPGPTQVVYMSSSFWLLAAGLRDLSQAEKETTACKCEQIHKLTAIWTQNDHFEQKKLPLCEFAQLSKQLFLSQHEINHVIQKGQHPKPRGHVDHLSSH